MATELVAPAGASQQSLERGIELLNALKRAAAAARLEVQVAELQAAVAEAQVGSGAHLERWLREFDLQQGIDSAQSRQWPTGNVQPTAAEYVPVEERIAVASRAVDDHTETTHHAAASSYGSVSEHSAGWSSYALNARLRLSQRGMTTAASDPCSDQSAKVSRHEYIGAMALGAAAASALGLSHDQNALCPITSQGMLDAEETEAPPADEAHVDDAVNATGDGEFAIKTTEERAPELLDVAALEIVVSSSGSRGVDSNRRPMMSGMSLSLIGHVALLGGLFMITYKPPSEAASLGSHVVSVSSVIENVETSQPFELPVPLELELPEMPLHDVAQAEPTALSSLETSTLDANLSDAKHQATHAASLAAAAMSVSQRSNHSSAGASGSGGGAALSKVGGKFFGVGAGGNFFCYVVDSSGSMRGGAWESAKQELVRSLATLSDRQRFYIVFFAKEISAIPAPGERAAAEHGLLATPANIDHARRWIETIKLDRGGPPNDALAWAIDRDPDAIYLLTDGVTKTDVCGYLRQENRLRDLVNGEQVRVPIHAIAYHSLDGQQLLRQVAQENNGQFHYVPAPEQRPNRR
jgi:hypothetical protein